MSQRAAVPGFVVARVSDVDGVDTSIVIVNWNTGDELRRCLASIVDAPPQGKWEAVVVDNGSTDQSIARAKEILPGATWIVNASNRGLAAANNQGLLAARGQMVVLSNPDVRFRPGTFSAFSSVLERHPRAAFVVPRVTYPDGQLQTTAGDLPSLIEAVLGREMQRRKRSYGSPTGMCWDGWAHDEEAVVGRAGDVCFAARREAIAQIGLQDERFPLDWEAFDWSARARDLGWTAVFSPDAQVVHHASTSTSGIPTISHLLLTHRGMYQYFANRSPAWKRPGLAGLFALRGIGKGIAIRVGMELQDAPRKRMARLAPGER
jgi:N-acetylglucosaminyl-diphospho-decaprenol L-rhamnosyltransferase